MSSEFAPLLRKSVDHHKYDHGHALILAGPAYQTGAARLAAHGAFRVGAGLVTVAAPPAAMAECAAQLTAIMLRQVASGRDLSNLLRDTRISAVCLGPGLGLTEEKTQLIEIALDADRPVVLDADALTLLAKNPSLQDALHDRCILSPHMGEFARLFPGIADRLSYQSSGDASYTKEQAVREAAERVGCVVLLKGPQTVIAGPSKETVLHRALDDRAAPWLATAGSGDVLAGFITGLLARGFTAMQAAQIATRLHVDCACMFGPGLIAEDLPGMVPKVLSDWGV